MGVDRHDPALTGLARRSYVRQAIVSAAGLGTKEEDTMGDLTDQFGKIRDGLLDVVDKPGPDVLANCPPDVVVGWYQRLATTTQFWYDKTHPGGTSLSATFLRHWCDPGRKAPDGTWEQGDLEFDVTRVVGNEFLKEALAEEIRLVFLSQRQKGHSANLGYGGAVVRLQQGWDGSPQEVPYETGSIKLVGDTVKFRLWTQLKRHVPVAELDWTNLDMYASLDTTGIKNTAVIRATPTPAEPNTFTIDFDSWTWHIIDSYNWDDPNPNLHQELPNPDYQKPPGPDVVAPDLPYFTVFHRNARRVEKAGLAAKFPIVSTEYTETNPALLKSAVVRTDKKLTH